MTKSPVLFAAIFAVLLGAARVEAHATAIHPAGGFELETPDGWKTTIDGTHIDLIRDSVIIHVYPVFRTITTLDDAYTNIADYFVKNGATPGEVRNVEEAGGARARWSTCASGDQPVFGVVYRDGSGYFLRAQVLAGGSAIGVEAAFSDVLATVRPTRSVSAPVAVVNDNYAFDHALWAYSAAFSLVEIVDASDRLLKNLSFGIEISEWDDEATGLEVAWESLDAVTYALNASHLSKNVGDYLDSAILQAAPSAPVSRISSQVELELDELIKSIDRALTDLSVAIEDCEEVYSESGMDELYADFNLIRSRLQDMRWSIENELLPKARRLTSLTAPA